LSVISAALEVHRVRHGIYPDTLTEMVDQGLLNGALLSPPDGVPLDYIAIGTDYALR